MRCRKVGGRERSPNVEDPQNMTAITTMSAELLSNDRIEVVLYPNSDVYPVTCYVCRRAFEAGSAVVEIRFDTSILGLVCEACLQDRRHPKLPNWETWREAEDDLHVYCDDCGLQFSRFACNCYGDAAGAARAAWRAMTGSDWDMGTLHRDGSS
jgi:hypothetical protein